jgi:hypothetical protein
VSTVCVCALESDASGSPSQLHSVVRVKWKILGPKGSQNWVEQDKQVLPGVKFRVRCTTAGAHHKAIKVDMCGQCVDRQGVPLKPKTPKPKKPQYAKTPKP